jgi:hypothetical protein
MQTVLSVGTNTSIKPELFAWSPLQVSVDDRDSRPAATEQQAVLAVAALTTMAAPVGKEREGSTLQFFGK